MMKLSIFLIIFSILQSIALPVHSQKAKVSISVENARLSDILEEVEYQTNYLFFYNKKNINLDKKISLNVNDVPVYEVLNKALDTDVSYLMVNDHIILSKKEDGFSGNNIISQQGSTITGLVTDPDGVSMPGVNVIVKGTTIGTITDGSGRYSITVPDKNMVLVFSFMGYVTQEVTTAEAQTIDIELKEEISEIEEVVVVGYGTQQRAKVTGSVAVVDGEDLKKAPVSNNILGLAGRVPGLISTNSSGRPGEGASVYIRGLSSYNKADALYVIDGMIRNADNFSQLDPNEIESISVLKDAGAAAVYGVRATNGVIVVTTRKGRMGKPVFSLGASLSLDSPTRFPDVMNAFEYAAFRNEANRNMGSPEFYTAQEIEDFRTGKSPSTNWKDATYKNNAVTQQYNLSVDGGSEAIRYFFNFGYLNQNGIYDNLGYERYNFRSNVEATLTKTLTATINLEGAVVNKKAPNVTDSYLWQLVNKTLPTKPAYYADGLPRYDLTFDTHPGEVTKHSGYNNSTNNRFVGQATLKQELPFLPGLSAKGSIQIWREYLIEKKFNKQYPTYEEDEDGNITATRLLGTKTTVWEQIKPANSYTLNLALEYDHSFRKHNVRGLILYEQYQSSNEELMASRTNYDFDTIDQIFAGSYDEERANDGKGSEDGRLGVIGRINYDYDSKYILEASFRSDASYRFAPNQRWGFFPSVSIGWLMSREDFIRNLGFVDYLKLRGSYGILGSDIVGGFQWRSSYSLPGTYPYYFSENAHKRLTTSVVPNPDLTWEKTATTNIGLDVTFFNRLIGLNVDVFKRHTYDILAKRTNQYPGVYGAELPDQNYGIIDAHGFEIVLTHQNKIDGFSYSVSGNVSFARNKVKEIDHAENVEPWENPIGKPAIITNKDKTVTYSGYRTGYTAIGLYQTDEEAALAPRIEGTNPKAGDIRYADLNNDGIIDPRDKSVLSWYNNTPEIMYGINLDASWKGFDLSIFFQGAANRNVMLSGYARNSLYNGNSYRYFMDRWTPENTGAAYPRAWIGTNEVNNQSSTYWLNDAGFLRLKNIQLAYTLPANISEMAGLSKVKIYVSGANLFVISKIKDFDPEFEGGDGFYYPQNKSFIFGVNISF